MANDGKIYIIVTDQLPGGGGPLVPDQPKQPKEEKDNALADYAKHRFFNFIEGQAKQAINYTVNNIGNFTGDYIQQQHVQDNLAAANWLINVGNAALAGFKVTGSPYGALLGAGIAVATSAISYGQQYYAGYLENARLNKNINQLRTRAGLNSSNNGSRGTEY